LQLREGAEVTEGWNRFLMPEEEYRHKLDVLAGHCKEFDRDPGDIRKQGVGDPRRDGGRRRVSGEGTCGNEGDR